MDAVDGRPGHVAFQSGHLNASTGAPAPSLPLFPDDPNKTTPAKWFAGRVLILPPVHGVALPRGAHLAQCLPGFGVSGSMGRDFDRFYFQRENPRLCRGGGRSLTFYGSSRLEFLPSSRRILQETRSMGTVPTGLRTNRWFRSPRVETRG